MIVVRLTVAARADIRRARTWLRQPGAARRAGERLSAIESAIRDLRRHSDRWPIGEHAGTRERSVAGYRLLYRIVEAESGSYVVVLRLFGPGQNRPPS